MKKIECDCSCATACPQGRIGSQVRCFVWKDDDPKVDPIWVLQGQINAQALEIVAIRQRLTESANVIAGMAAKIEQLTERADVVDRRLGQIIAHVGVPMNAAAPPTKRTIKGGWVNVYDYGHGVLHCSPIFFRTRAECDTEGTNSPIACIQIPDITEGEGLS